MVLFRHGIAIIALLLIAALGAWVLADYVSTLTGRYWRRKGDVTVGTVVDRRTRTTSYPPTWRPVETTYGVVRYRDHNGREHTFEVVGDRPLASDVRVLYSRRRPHRAMADTDGVRPGCGLLWLATAIIALIAIVLTW